MSKCVSAKYGGHECDAKDEPAVEYTSLGSAWLSVVVDFEWLSRTERTRRCHGVAWLIQGPVQADFARSDANTDSKLLMTLRLPSAGLKDFLQDNLISVYNTLFPVQGFYVVNQNYLPLLLKYNN